MTLLTILRPSVLYIGSISPGTTSLHRAEALVRLGYSVVLIDPSRLIPRHNHFLRALDYRTGFRFLQAQLKRELEKVLVAKGLSFQVVWVNGGEMLGPSLLKWLSSFCCAKTILYQNDDPTGLRDSNKFISLRTAIPFYDLFVSVRCETIAEALALGAQRVLRVFTSHDELLHSPDQINPDQSPNPVVSFVGTLIPGERRDQFMAALMEAGLPLRISGNLWQRSRLWPVLQKIYAGPALLGPAYSHALRNASVSLGLLSHQNRDLLTRRTFEIPAYGGMLCGERTSETQLFYEDGYEAMLWSSVDECISQSNKLLKQTKLSLQMRKNGYRLVRSLGVGNEDICRQVMACL